MGGEGWMGGEEWVGGFDCAREQYCNSWLESVSTACDILSVLWGSLKIHGATFHS